MKQRNFYILLAIFVTLLVITLLQSQPQTNSDAQIPPVPTLVNFLGKDMNMTVLDIVAIRLRDPNTDKTFIISRNAVGNWTAPQSQGSLDTTAASNMAKAVVLMEYDSITPITDTTDLRQFGFNPQGQLSVEVLLQDNQSHVILIGDLTPSNLNYYGQVDNSPKVYFFARGAVDFLLAQLNHPPLT